MVSTPQHHSIESKCGIDGTSRAYWSLNPLGKLLFFIHGFGGGALTTWRKFPQLLLADDQWAGWDLFFYGYDSRPIRAGISAQILSTQIDHVVEQSGYANVWPLTRRPDSFRYSEIWFIAHSLGAPIVRQAIVAAADRNAYWIDQSYLFCFAPASGGARINRLAWFLGTTGGTLLGIFHAIIRYRWAVIDDMEVGSRFLTDLLSNTVRVSRGVPREPFGSRLTLFGWYEDVIDYPPPFPFDTRVKLIANADHCSVCKPQFVHHPPYFHLKEEVNP
jgi:pimeloyl-ACP methyl ester carboxylesterase